MSALLSTKATIDCLVQSMVVTGVIEMDQKNEIGKELWLENYRSLNARYGDSVPAHLPYKFAGIEAPLDPAVVLRLTRFYDYQSCEGEERYAASLACDLIGKLQQKLYDMPGSDREVEGLWGIQHLEEATLYAV